VILHFLEVWVTFIAVFAGGCWLGASIYSGLARGRLATAQGVVADAVGDVLDEIKWRVGLAPDWRPGYEAAERQHVGPEVEADLVQETPRVSLPQSTGEQERTEIAKSSTGWATSGETSNGGGASASEIPPASDVRPPPLVSDGSLADHRSMMRPAGLSEPRAGVPDNLQRIRGVGKRNEALLHSFGIYHFGQIAAWTPAEARWVASHLAFPESLEGDDWVGQAIVLASGAETGYLPRSERRKRERENEGES
jgi:predicted flap endonuclease-1-like 5' DNA nuclease